MKQVPGCLKIWEQGNAEREAIKQQKAEELRQQKEKATRERQLAIQQQQLVVAEQKREIASISDSQDIALVTSIMEQAKQLITSNESIEFIAVQQKPVVNIKPDAVVITNRRLIFFSPKLLGRFEFRDYLWRDLGDAHLKQGILGSTFTARHTSGELLTMTYLSKEAAAKLYRLAQEREEDAIEFRRQRMIEEKQAGAAKIAIQNNLAPPVPAQVIASQKISSGSDDLVARLEKLKMMLDKQLITVEDYEQRKKEMLAQL